MTGFTGNGEGGITQGATENIFSVSNATSWVRGSHNIRFGLQAQYRRYQQLTEVPPRGGFTFNGQFTGNNVADFLLGYCSTCTGAFGSSRSLYTSPTIAPFIDDNWQMSSKLTLQMGLRWEYLGPWHEQNNQEGSFDAATGKIAFNVVPSNLPAQLVPLIINQNGFFPPGILQKDLNNWGPRIGAAYTVNDNTVVRSGFGMYYDNLNLNELQFSRLVPPFYGQFSLQPTRTDLSMQVDTLFPDLNNIPQFPAPFSMDPTNRTAYTVQWNGNVQRTLGNHYVFEVAYTGSRSYNEHKRYNINQAQPGTTPIATRVPYPAFQSAILYSSDGGWAKFNGLTARVEKRYSDGFFFLGSYQLSKNTDNGSGEVEANGAEGQAEGAARVAERVRVERAIDGIDREEPAEEEDLGHEEDPHAEPRRVVLLNRVIELVRGRRRELLRPRRERGRVIRQLPPPVPSSGTAARRRSASPRSSRSAAATASATRGRSRPTGSPARARRSAATR